MRDFFKKKVIYQVQCAFNKNHIFEKKLEIQEGSDLTEDTTEMEAYCPYCNNMVKFTVKGRPVPDEFTLRTVERIRKQTQDDENK
jgi:hypothetical protein